MSLPVFIRTPALEDCQELLALHQQSRSLHFPWVRTPLTERDCQAYIQRCQREDYEGLLICQAIDAAVDRHSKSQIIGVANLSQIFHHNFQNAYLGYYAHIDFAGLGLMSVGIQLTIDYAFKSIGLHRIEANIQSENTPSINLVNRLGFRKEGFSPRYLYINGEWRDHERWALTIEDWQ
jgi:ribosomal-protein-alanine N-acetyltransferase